MNPNNSKPEAGTPQENPTPRFPGFREMAADEILVDGDMVCPHGGNKLTPTLCMGGSVSEKNVGCYFRPIPPISEVETAVLPREAHTPLPWHVGKSLKAALGLRILPVYGPSGEVAADLEFLSDRPDTKAVAEANANMIVSAVNSHSTLAEAVTKAQAVIACRVRGEMDAGACLTELAAILDTEALVDALRSTK